MFEWLRRAKPIQEEKASKAAAVKIVGLGGKVWPQRNYKTFADEAYLKNVVAFRCIDEIAKSVASVPWGLKRKLADGNKEQVQEHPLNDLLHRTSPEDSFQSFMLRACSFLVLSGNTYIEKVSPTTGDNVGLTKELYSLRPDRINIQANKQTGMVESYIYTVSGQDIIYPVDPVTLQGDLLQIKLFHPTDDWYGASPVEPTSREIDTDNAGTEWNKNLLDNEARPGLILTTDGMLTESQFEQMENQLKDRHAGPDNAHDSLILHGGLKAQPYGFNPSELDFIEGSREVARDIAMGFGVPPQVIGISGENTFANVKEARLAMWETTVMFYLRMFQSELNNWLIPEEQRQELALEFILDEIPALESRRSQKWDKAQKSDFLTINEKREMVGLEAYDEGDVILVSSSMIPLGEEIPSPEDDVEQEEDTASKLAAMGYSDTQIDNMMSAAYKDYM